MKKVLLITLLFVVAKSYSQQFTPSQAWGNSFNRFRIILGDTVSTKLNGCLAVINGNLYVANGAIWNLAGGNGVARFNHDVVVNLPAGTGRWLGAFYDGETIPLNGKRVDSLPDILATKCVAPTYVAPTAGISASPSNGSYEIGTNLGTVTLSSSFTQNNGGANTTTTYYQNGSPLGGNTTTISSLTSTQSFYVNKAYGQGAVINNNCGVPDPTGRINAGSVNSGTISFVPFSKRYWGFVSSTSPNNSTILALTQDNNGSTGSLTLSNVTPSGSQYLAYFTKGSVSSVTVNGIPATGAFTFTTYSITNAQGYTQTYTYVYSNNPQTSTLSSVIFN